MTTKPQGYDFNFVDKLPDDCICKICHLALRQPVQTKCCGHRFCKDCLVEATKRKAECPLDRKPLNIQKDVFDDKGAERNVKSLRITCPRKSSGCTWQGELADVEVHDQKCDYMIVPCTFQHSGCNFKTQRKNMKDHLEKKIEDHLALTSNCLSSLQEENKKLKRTMEEDLEKKIEDHLALIENENEKLKTLVKGCLEKKFDLKDIMVICLVFVFVLYLAWKPNEEIKNTIAEIKDHLALTQNENEKLKKTIAEMKEQVIPCTNKFIWKINNFSHDLEKAKQSSGGKHGMNSDPFYTEKYGYKMRVELYPDGDRDEAAGNVGIFVEILRGEYDAVLPWPFAREITISLLDQKQKVQQRKDKRITITYKDTLDKPQNFGRPATDSNIGRGYPQFISHEQLMTENYIVDDTVFVQVEIGEEYTHSYF